MRYDRRGYGCAGGRAEAGTPAEGAPASFMSGLLPGKRLPKNVAYATPPE